MKNPIPILVLGCAALATTSAVAAPKTILISLDGATPRLVEQYLASGDLPANEGLGLLQSKGFKANLNQTVSPSLTAVGHVAIATGSTAAKNNVVANSFHLVASPFDRNISGFGAPIGGYGIDGPVESPIPTAEPIWLRLRLVGGKKVVTATWPGGDGVDVRVPGALNNAIVQPASERTVDFTVPFGAFSPLSGVPGSGAQGFSLTAADFSPAPAETVNQLTAAGNVSYSPILQKTTLLETLRTSGAVNPVSISALDTTNDGAVNYDTLVFFNTNLGIQPGPFALPSTGPAYLKAGEQRGVPFFIEGSANKAGCAYYASRLEPDLSVIHIARTSANSIPRNAAVIGDVDDVNGNVGFWAPQPDFRIVERISPGFGSFTDLELEAIYADRVRDFTDYQKRLALHAIRRVPEADLVMVYFEQPDGSGHQFLLVDPRQPTDFTNPNSIGAGQDPAKVARYAHYLKVAYQTANAAVQSIIAEVGVNAEGRPNSNIIVTSDHGFDPFHTAVNMNALLASAGIPSSKVRAITSGPAVNIYINLQGREPGGTVLPAEYLPLQTQVVGLLQGLVDTNPTYSLGAPVSVFDKIYPRPVPADPGDPSFGRATTEFIGQDSGDVFALLRTGYNFDGIQNPVVVRQGDPTPAGTSILSVPNFYGAHGYDPELENMSSIFFAAGPDIGQGVLPLVRNIDIAPTIAAMLGVETYAAVDGTSLPLAPLAITRALSRKTHGHAGTFDLELPTKGTLGVEGRKATLGSERSHSPESADEGGEVDGRHKLIFTFNKPLIRGGASVLGGIGRIAKAIVAEGKLEVIVAEVRDAQRLTLILTATDIYQGGLSTEFTFGVLRGDVDGNGIINQTDVDLAAVLPKNSPATALNFSRDVSVNGTINNADIAQARVRVGRHLP